MTRTSRSDYKYWCTNLWRFSLHTITQQYLKLHYFRKIFFWLLDWQLGPTWNETHVTRFSPKCKSFQVNVPSLFPQNLSRFSGIFMGDKKEDIDLKMKKQPPEIFCKKRSSKKKAKRDSNSSAFIWNLRDFYGHLFWETAVDDYFW